MRGCVSCMGAKKGDSSGLHHYEFSLEAFRGKMNVDTRSPFLAPTFDISASY